MRNFHNKKISRDFFRENTKCENFVNKKIPRVISATINCAKKIVKFSALTAQYLKFIFHIKNFSCEKKQKGEKTRKFYFRERCENIYFPYRFGS